MPAWRESNDWRDARILAIDDEPLVNSVIVKILKIGQFRCVESIDDATLAIEKITEYVPDLVLLDIRMPKLNGIDLLKQIKADQQFETTTVVMLTASGDDTKQECLELGAIDYINKPVDPQELLLRIRNALKMASEAKM